MLGAFLRFRNTPALVIVERRGIGFRRDSPDIERMGWPGRSVSGTVPGSGGISGWLTNGQKGGLGS